MPVLAAELERDRARAQALATAVVAGLAAALAGVLLAGECLCGLVWIQSADPALRLLVGLTAAMLPYLWFVCLAAQLAATLQALSRFSVPALAAAVMNIGWLVGAWWIAPAVSTDKTTQAYALAGCVVAAGALQAAVQLAALRRAGFAWRIDWRASAEPGLRVLRALGPLAIALGVTQINTLVDSLVALGLTAPARAATVAAAAGAATVDWLPGGIEYPLRTGATAALYYAERFYQFPVGLLGVAVATAIFPLLSRHAAHGRREQLGTDLVGGLRLVCFTSLPAAVGLMLLAKPLTALLFEHGAFTADDAARTARTTAGYALGICAYAMLPVLARGFYAAGDMRTPLATSLLGMSINVALDLTLVWPLGECGLALATAVSASVQTWAMVRLFSQRHGALDQSPLRITMLKTACASALMSGVVLAVPWVLGSSGGRWHDWLQVGGSVLAGAATFLLAARLLRCDELAMLRPGAAGASDPSGSEGTSGARIPPGGLKAGRGAASELAPRAAKSRRGPALGLLILAGRRPPSPVKIAGRDRPLEGGAHHEAR